MAITTENKVKTMYNISDKVQIEAIKILIPMVEAQIKSYCNNEFLTGYPADVELAAIKLVYYNLNWKGYTAESVDDASVSYSTDIPADVKSILRNHRIVKFA